MSCSTFRTRSGRHLPNGCPLNQNRKTKRVWLSVSYQSNEDLTEVLKTRDEDNPEIGVQKKEAVPLMTTDCLMNSTTKGLKKESIELSAILTYRRSNPSNRRKSDQTFGSHLFRETASDFNQKWAEDRVQKSSHRRNRNTERLDNEEVRPFRGDRREERRSRPKTRLN